MTNITDITFSLDRKFYKKGTGLLHSNKLLSMTQDEELVFNAEFSNEKEKILTEVALDENLDIEDVFCDCGSQFMCPHIIATLIGAELMIMENCNDLQTALSSIQNK